jgi:hypothetical protein
MSEMTTIQDAAPLVPADAVQPTTQSMFGPPALVPGEDRADYEALRARISAAVKPKDFLEEMWVRDVSDQMWDTLRMRRFKANLLTAAKAHGLELFLKPGRGIHDAQTATRCWVKGTHSGVQEVNQQLAKMDANGETLSAFALVAMIDEFERLDRMIANAESRRNATLREIERHREAVAKALRRASDEILEAEFEDVAPDQIAQTEPA